MTEAIAYTLLTDRLKLAAAAVDLPVAFKDVSFPAQGLGAKPSEYLEVDFFPNDPTNRMLGKGREMFPGIFQVQLVTTEQVGVAPRYETARQVADFYVKGEVLFGEGAKIKVSKKPAIASALRDNGETRIPITVEYEFFA